MSFLLFSKISLACYTLNWVWRWIIFTMVSIVGHDCDVNLRNLPKSMPLFNEIVLPKSMPLFTAVVRRAKKCFIKCFIFRTTVVILILFDKC